jgi:hypothetical protein
VAKLASAFDCYFFCNREVGGSIPPGGVSSFYFVFVLSFAGKEVMVIGFFFGSREVAT